ncbi:putative GNAT family acetyltransferase [Chaetomium sp. MPI-SDFR-AT-0129]|nr:putative GNAT family acetyltransferase [Chaetomium sp. MPI-SDFR-AT-0129]
MASQNTQAARDRPDETTSHPFPTSFPLGPPARPGQALLPPKQPLIGHTTSLVPLQPTHAPALYKHLGGEDNAWRWTYMLSGGYPDYAEFETVVAAWSTSRDRDYYVILSGPGTGSGDDDGVEALGLVAYLGVSTQMRRLEIGGVILGGALTRSRRATEAFFLFLRHAFDDLGYSRVEWKANQLNSTSMRAATRLGFEFEGVFRKHMVVKGRVRDTAWFSMTDDEWPGIKRGFESWLDDSNFDEHGKQKRTLQECREQPTGH